MEDKCPKCGETLLTRTIKKKIGLGSIDYPIAQTCPKCNWNKDLTGAGDIKSKPVMQDAGQAQKEEKKTEIKSQIKQEVPVLPSSKPAPTSINSLIPIVLAILVVAAIAWVFFMDPTEEGPLDSLPITPPIINQTPVKTPTTTIIPEVTATGRKVPIRLESDRGFSPKNSTIKPGDEVVWTNDGTYNVILVSSENIFQEKSMSNGKRETYVFIKPGTYNFFIKGKENLKGTIIVEP